MLGLLFSGAKEIHMVNEDDSDIEHIYKCVETEGYIRIDPFGRIYVDQCPTDEEHLTSRPPNNLERHRCRKYLGEVALPEEFIGKRVKVSLEILIEYYEEN